MAEVLIITVSDRSFRGERSDLSGEAVSRWVETRGMYVRDTVVVPDEIDAIVDALERGVKSCTELILTTGGTGFAPRDVTPEATRMVIEREAPGFAEVMRSRSLEITPHAMLSRAVAGIRDKSLIINLPGSPKAVIENLGFIEEAIPHALELLANEVTDCGG